MDNQRKFLYPSVSCLFCLSPSDASTWHSLLFYWTHYEYLQPYFLSRKKNQTVEAWKYRSAEHLSTNLLHSLQRIVSVDQHESGSVRKNVIHFFCTPHISTRKWCVNFCWPKGRRKMQETSKGRICTEIITPSPHIRKWLNKEQVGLPFSTTCTVL